VLGDVGRLRKALKAIERFLEALILVNKGLQFPKALSKLLLDRVYEVSHYPSMIESARCQRNTSVCTGARPGMRATTTI